jgi:hypothetical protein
MSHSGVGWVLMVLHDLSHIFVVLVYLVGVFFDFLMDHD